MDRPKNAEFARLAKAKRIVFFEGKERNLIRKIAVKVGLGSLLDDPYTLYLQAGGFAQWRRIKEVDWALHEVFGLDAKIGALFDRDYRSDEEVEDFQRDLASDSLWVRVLGRKEIENYALEVGPLARTMVTRAATRGIEVEIRDAVAMIAACTEEFEEDCSANFLTAYTVYHKARRKDLADATHMKAAVGRFNSRWKKLEHRLSVLPGKEFLAALSTRMQKTFGTSLTIHQVIDEMEERDVDPELRDKLESLTAFFAGRQSSV